MIGVATSGGWRQRLPEKCVTRIETAWGDLMATVGHELVTAGPPICGVGPTKEGTLQIL